MLGKRKVRRGRTRVTLDVSDVRSNSQDQIAHAVRVIGRSKGRRKVFEAIYTGKKKVKTVSELLKMTKLKNRVIVLQRAKELSDNKIVKQTKSKGETAYEKYPFFMRNKKKILSLVNNPKKFSKFPTKTSPKFSLGKSFVSVRFPKKMVNITQITIDDIDTLSKVRKIKTGDINPKEFYEKTIKKGLQKIIGESGKFTDWGGENDDLFTTRLKIKGKRYVVAFGLKGISVNGRLTPKKMGKNGDQVQRLFRSPAQVFIVQYHDQIDSSILEQMQKFAIAKSVMENRKIFFGIIDGQDTSRIISAYPSNFRK